jgi:uridine kinase
MRVIGISGPSCSGKSTLATKLSGRLQDCCVIQQDWFFVDPARCPPDANFCDLGYLHVDEFVAACTDLCAGRSAHVPAIDFGTFEKIGVARIEPRRWIIIEGMTIFRIPQVAELCDLRFYLSPPYSEIRARKRRRDAIERNKAPTTIESQLKWMKDEYDRDLVMFGRSVIFLSDQSIDRLTRLVLERVDGAKVQHEEEHP